MIYIQSGVFSQYEYHRIMQAADIVGMEYVWDDIISLLQYKPQLSDYFYGSLVGHDLFFASTPQRRCVDTSKYTLQCLWNVCDEEVLVNKKSECKYRVVTNTLLDDIESGKEAPFFMRTPLGDKSVPGVILEPEEISFLRGYYEGRIVATFPIKNLGAEVRFVFFNGKPLTASQYITNNGKIELCPQEYFMEEWDKQLRLLSHEINEKYDRFFTIDFAYDLDEEEWKVLEHNSMWCAGLYGCDWGKILDCVKYLECITTF